MVERARERKWRELSRVGIFFNTSSQRGAE